MFSKSEAIGLGVCVLVFFVFVAVVIPRVEFALAVFDHLIGGMK